MRKLLSIMLVLMLTLTLFAGGQQDSTESASEEAITLTLGHVIAEGTPLDLGAHRLADLVSEATDGRITIEVYANSALGDNRAMLESLQMGTLDMQTPAVAALSGFTDSTLLLDLPFLFKNTAHAEAVLDGKIGQDIFTNLESAGLVGLAWMTQGWRELSTTDIEVHTPADMEGMKLRTMNNKIHIAAWNELGASAVPMSFSEVFTSLQQGVLDAQENPISNIYMSGFYEVQGYIIKTDHVYDPIPLIMSKITWSKLSDADKTIILECAAKAAAYEREITTQADADYEKKIVDMGTTKVITLTDAERAAFKKGCRPIYAEYAGVIGQDRFDVVAAMADEF